MNDKRIIAITMGDPAGVGPEICLKALGEDRLEADYVPVLFGDLDVLRKVSYRSGIPLYQDLRIVTLAEWQAGYFPNSACVVDMKAVNAVDVEAGQLSTKCGGAAYRYIETAIESAKAGRVGGVVTAPINKEALRAAGIQYPGHTEIFGALTGCKSYCMMLTSPVLSVSFVTTHRSMASVSESITEERVYQVIQLTSDAMKKLTGKLQPKIAVLGLNPHAGEHGLFGNEEAEKIEPAVEQAREQGIDVSDPLPPDTAFAPHIRPRYDAFVCMYHDQGHIPFKMLAFETGVNTTLGLPVVRTSVDHGTAFDIAWQGKASPASLVQAIHYAIRLTAGK